jgi:hypothetical protein
VTTPVIENEVEQQESTGDTSDCIFCPCSPHLSMCGKYDPSPVIEWLSEPGGCPDCLDVWGLYGCPRCPCSYEVTCSGCRVVYDAMSRPTR